MRHGCLRKNRRRQEKAHHALDKWVVSAFILPMSNDTTTQEDKKPTLSRKRVIPEDRLDTLLKDELHDAEEVLEAAFRRLEAACHALPAAHVAYEMEYGEPLSITDSINAKDPRRAKIVEAHREIQLAEAERNSARVRVENAKRALLESNTK